MRISSASRIALVFAALPALAACGANQGAATGEHAGDVAPSASDAPGPASSPAPDGLDAGSDAAGDASASAGLRTNLAGAKAYDVGKPARPDLRLVSTNFVERVAYENVEYDWLTEVKNVGTARVCDLRVGAAFQWSFGQTLVQYRDIEVRANPYLDGDTVTHCLEPGEVGSAEAIAVAKNGYVGTVGLTRIEVSFTSTSHPNAVPAPDAPTFTGTITPDGHGVTGTIDGHGAAVADVLVDLYVRDAKGLVIGHLTALDLTTLQPGEAHPFTTPPLDTIDPIVDYRAFVQYAPIAQLNR